MPITATPSLSNRRRSMFCAHSACSDSLWTVNSADSIGKTHGEAPVFGSESDHLSTRQRNLKPFLPRRLPVLNNMSSPRKYCCIMSVAWRINNLPGERGMCWFALQTRQKSLWRSIDQATYKVTDNSCEREEKKLDTSLRSNGSDKFIEFIDKLSA